MSVTFDCGYTLLPTHAHTQIRAGRLKDELRIVVGKALGQSCPTYIRAGVIGAAAELSQSALNMGGEADGVYSCSRRCSLACVS